MQDKSKSKPSYTKTMPPNGMALSILAVPLNVDILRSLEEGPRSQLDLRHAVGSPPHTTMRVYARALSEQGILESRRLPKPPSSPAFELTQSGRELLGVAGVLEEWLGLAPGGPIRLGTTASKSSIKALTEGWSTNIVRVIAARPLSLTQLNKVLPKISYPTLGRRLESMRMAGLVTPYPDGSRVNPYAPTDWLRRSVVPVAAATSWERQQPSDDLRRIGRHAVEAAFLLAIPLLKMPSEFSGKCRLVVELQEGGPVFAGVLVSVEAGRVVSCSSRLEGQVEASASGSADLWIERLRGGDDHALELEGDTSIAEEILHGLESALTLSPAPDTDKA